jgi:glutathione S-transferase
LVAYRSKRPFSSNPFSEQFPRKPNQVIVLKRFLLIAVFYGPQLKLHIEFIENELAKSTWFAGDELTGAGISVL